MNKYIIMGPQGCGKGTQAKKLEEDLGWIHISLGDILRWAIQHRTKLGAKVNRTMAAGQLVSDEVVEEVIVSRLERHDWNFGFVLDGFPRNHEQAMFFRERYDVDAVIHIDVPDEVVMERIMSRRICTGCGLDYNLIHHRPAKAGVCDVCGGRLEARADDQLEAVKGRLRDYHERTQPILDMFEGQVVTVDGTRSKDEVYAELREKLGVPIPVEVEA
jgi:adenylate kinase